MKLQTKWLPLLVLALVLALSLLLRVQHIRADPPPLLPALSGSASIYFDEGIYSHNARNKILYGIWITDQWNPFIYNIVLTVIYFLSFKLAGISIVTVKVINIVFGILGLWIFYLSLRDYLSRFSALLLTTAFSLNFYWLMFNRIGLLENFSTLCFILTFYFFVKAEKKPVLILGCGIFVTLAVLSKYLFIYFFLTVVLAVIYRSWRTNVRRQIVLLFLSVGIMVGGWLFFIYLPYSHLFAKIGKSWGGQSLPGSLPQMISNLTANPFTKFMTMMPVEFLLTLIFSAVVMMMIWRFKKEPVNSIDLFIFAWFWGAFLEMGLINYRPLRYYLPAIAAIYLAVSRLLARQETIARFAHWIAGITLIWIVIFKGFFIMLLRKPSAFFVLPIGIRLILLTSLALILATLLIKKPIFHKVGQWMAWTAMVLCSLGLYWGQFYQKPLYNLELASDYFKTLPANSVIMGQEAPRLTLETRLKAVMAYKGWFNDENPFEDYRPTHLVVLDRFNQAELAWIQERFKPVADRLKRIRKFFIWDTTVSLYQIRYPN